MLLAAQQLQIYKVKDSTNKETPHILQLLRNYGMSNRHNLNEDQLWYNANLLYFTVNIELKFNL